MPRMSFYEGGRSHARHVHAARCDIWLSSSRLHLRISGAMHRRVHSSTSVMDPLTPVRRSARIAARTKASKYLPPAIAEVCTQEEFSSFERATQFVLNHSILWLCLPLYLALTCEPPRFLLGSGLIATAIASYMHWSDVRYGGWRHQLDGIVAASTVAWHMWHLMRDPEIPDAQVYAAWLSLVASASSFATGWHRHLHGKVGQGMCFHLMFRFGAFWPILIAHNNHRYSEYDEWAVFIATVVAGYSATSFALWRCACAINNVGLDAECKADPLHD